MLAEVSLWPKERQHAAEEIQRILGGSPYGGYAYSYPHKTSYRPFAEPRSLESLWRNEDKSALFLYVHIPFCEMRCGFCNLFTRIGRDQDAVESYLKALHRQALAVSSALGNEARFARAAIGGGTPTFMSAMALEHLFDILESVFNAPLRHIPLSVETSPETASHDRLQVLCRRGASRISIGIQSFLDAELKSLGRPVNSRDNEAALDRIRAVDPDVLNVDLIYGARGQTVSSWMTSLKRALTWAPEELYLYPLYVRPLTGLGKRDRRVDDDIRVRCYQEGRAFLLDQGYDQISMRLFRRKDVAASAGPIYCCQEDGMVGLGCGARSYTTEVHYSDEWAVGKTAVADIITAWMQRDNTSFGHAHYGVLLDEEEQKHRYLIKSILHMTGLDQAAYASTFGKNPHVDFPQLGTLKELGLLRESNGVLRPTAEGLAWSDRIGPWLYSAATQSRMNDFQIV